MHIKRNNFTLLELLISMSFLVILLTTLTFFYSFVDRTQRESDKERYHLFRTVYVESRLSSIIPQLQEKEYFFTSHEENGTSLVFTFDNGICLDKEFSSSVLGKIYLDRQQRLILRLWNHPKKWEEDEIINFKKEVLLEDVEAIEWNFFAAFDKDQKVSGWVQEWVKEYQALPAIIKLRVILKTKKEHQFAFPVPYNGRIIKR